jgi:hypothetical protein
LKEQPLKKAVLQPVGRKTARASAKPTEFCKKLSYQGLFKRGFDKGSIRKYNVIDLFLR